MILASKKRSNTSKTNPGIQCRAMASENQKVCGAVSSNSISREAEDCVIANTNTGL